MKWFKLFKWTNTNIWRLGVHLKLNIFGRNLLQSIKKCFFKCHLCLNWSIPRVFEDPRKLHLASILLRNYLRNGKISLLIESSKTKCGSNNSPIWIQKVPIYCNRSIIQWATNVFEVFFQKYFLQCELQLQALQYHFTTHIWSKVDLFHNVL